MGIESAGPTLLNLPDRTGSLFTGVEELVLELWVEIDYSAMAKRWAFATRGGGFNPRRGSSFLYCPQLHVYSSRV